MAAVWTHGTWVVKPGSEDAFVQAWTDLARTTMATLGSARPTLLRDRDRPNVFKTFGSWPDVAAVEAFRASDAFREGTAILMPLLESFEPMTLDEIDWA
jgi:quinol monooxygenase YgiN